MSNLVESIISGDYAVAKELFDDRIGQIKECKLYEAKRHLASEAFGGKSPQQIKSQPGYRGRASDVLGLSPYDKSREDKKKRIAAAAEKTTSTADKAREYVKAQKEKQTKAKDIAVKKARAKAKPEAKEKVKPDYADTPTGRNRKRADDIAARNPPGSAGLKIAKGIGKVAGFIARDIVGSIPG